MPTPMHSPDELGFLLEQRVPLAPYTTFGIGGPAAWFTAITSESELESACAWADKRQLPLFILGGGSNVLVADEGFPGLVVHMAMRGMAQQGAAFRVAAGESWDALVSWTVESGCAGMECLAGIPGTVGGTPVQNVGAYGQEVAQTITEVRCFDRATASFVTFTGAECGFAYRTSRFNTAPDRDRYIVTEVVFTLQPGGAPLLSYADLQRHFAGAGTRPTLAATAEVVRAIRRIKGMVIDGGMLPERDPDTRSAGSFFKNPVVTQALYEDLCSLLAPASVPSYPAPDAADGSARRKLPAAWLLEQAGFAKGFALGGAAVSSKHTLALTNRSGHASAAEILALRDVLVTGVVEKFGVFLEPEPIFVGSSHSVDVRSQDA